MVSPLITVDIIPGWITFFVWPAGRPPELKMRCRQDKQWHWSNNSYLHTLQIQQITDNTVARGRSVMWPHVPLVQVQFSSVYMYYGIEWN